MVQHNFAIYRKLSLLLSNNIHIYDILNFLGIDKIFLYGIGEMGNIVLSDLKDTDIVKGIFDKKVLEGDVLVNGEITVLSPNEIPKDNTYILISPANGYCEIVEELLKLGISKKRLISLNVLLHYGYYYLLEHDEGIRSLEEEKEFLIVGATFDNKGSQAMTFVAINELRKKYGNPVIWFCPNYWDEIYNREKYKMIILEDGYDRESTVNEIMPRLTAVIDVSGYGLFSYKGFGGTNRIMSHLKMAFNFDIPYFFMPQSFGPLDFPKYMLAEMKVIFSYARLIFARESKGKILLENKLQLNNVIKSTDMVLQNALPINKNNIYFSRDIRKYMMISGQSVAIIPNQNLISNNNKKNDIFVMYKKIIEKLIKLNLNTYIVPHSDDNKLCEKIYSDFQENNMVHICENDFDCIEFCEFVKKFKYIIGSRYHAIVHAYKQGIPSIIIGWAEKYKELTESFEQQRFLFDVRQVIDVDKILLCIDDIEMNYFTEAEIIRDYVKKYQTQNCFEKVFEMIE